MALIDCPADIKLPAALRCVVCGETISAEAAALAGHTSGGPLFMCETHYTEPSATLFRVWPLTFTSECSVSNSEHSPAASHVDRGNYYIETSAHDAATLMPPGLDRRVLVRLAAGPVAIVTNRPEALLPPLRKQWVHLVRCLQRERSRTLNAGRIRALTPAIMTAQHARFTFRSPGEDPAAVVYIVRPSSLDLLPPTCQTLLMLASGPSASQAAATAKLPAHSLVVLFFTTRRTAPDRR